MSGSDGMACILNMLIENLEHISFIELEFPGWKREYQWHGVNWWAQWLSLATDTSHNSL